MKNLLFSFALSTLAFSAYGQWNCSQMGMLVNVSDTDLVKLYHGGPYVLWPREKNKIYWEITDLQGGMIHQDTTVGEMAGNMTFSHNVPLTDSMQVSAVILHDSLVDIWTGAVSQLACKTVDTLYWKPNEIIPGVFTYRWEFVGVPNQGISVMSASSVANKELELRVYPNPASSRLFIEPGTNEPKAISIYNVHGQLVYFEEHSVGNRELNIQDFAAGTYVLVLGQNQYELFQVAR